MMQLRNLNRFQAFAWHFLFSAVLGLAVFLLFRFIWYPGALWTLSGAGKLLLLVVGIDVTLGPLLTLIVFNPKKRSLPFDLATIAAVQCAALAYGVWVMAQSRPVYLVGVVDRIVLVSANDLSPEALAEAAKPEYRELSWTGPVLVGANSNARGDEQLNLALNAALSGIDLERLPKYYVDFRMIVKPLFERAVDLDELMKRDPEKHRAIVALMADFGVDPSDVHLLPLQARSGFGSVLIDAASLEIVASTSVDLFD